MRKQPAAVWCPCLMLSVLVLLSAACAAQEDEGPLAPETANEARLNRIQPQELVLDAIGLKPGMKAAEIGAGRGRYVVQMAVRVGRSGAVYAEDIDADGLRHIEQRCARWGIANVETILGDVTDPKLPAGELDLIFVISSYHHFSDPTALLRNARSALKPDGRLAIAEWYAVYEENRNAGTTAPDLLERQMIAAGYEIELIVPIRVVPDKSLNIYIFHIAPEE